MQLLAVIGRKLRHTFGLCKDRWRHDWKYVGDQHGFLKHNTPFTRTCTECKLSQKAVGAYQLDSDLGAITQWETTSGPSP